MSKPTKVVMMMGLVIALCDINGVHGCYGQLVAVVMEYGEANGLTILMLTMMVV